MMKLQPTLKAQSTVTKTISHDKFKFKSKSTFIPLPQEIIATKSHLINVCLCE